MIDFLFSQYEDYSTLQIILEIIAVLFGLVSVWFAKKNNILVYPTGIVSTVIYIYLLYKWELIGDLLINIYYTSMSIYGWWLWSQKKENQVEYPIANVSKKEIGLGIVIFIITVFFVVLVYHFFNKFTSWTAYVDTFTTGIFFVGMWLMAKRKIENWILWIIGDIVSIPLYFSKGYTFTSLQYVIFTVIAIYAYKEWKRNLVN
ncbi:nicotinamide riboside transporter PnuC [Flavobacterium sp. TP390]|uniref:Nicotinamide riboside transporter PnuC n=1 Tax=Flavobacterium profundi TaxID=1774945 RepID=A0A6I4IL64_9FLAO|nr:nicotinamide riboside transporter PnuC [Flavobacterium profundi]MVO08942.1 nicotinamide riboside transporter PnuC [Flavobacterium profundi]